MKKIYFSFLPFLATVALNAQLTQTNHAPAAGEKYDTYQCDTVSPGGAGANQTWNFSAASTHSSIVKSYTVLAASNPAYPSAPISVAASANNTSYLSSSGTGLWYYGGNISVGPVVATLNYSAPAVYASYPMSLNTTSSSVIGGSINVSAPLSASGTFTGNSTVTADGTGSLTIAGTTYTNVMRLAISQVVNFTTNVASGSVLQMNYMYYDAGTKAPIVSVETSTASIPFSTTTQTIVQRLKAAPVTTSTPVGIRSYSEDRTVNVYPNPANTEVNFITNDQSARSISVFDITGKMVDRQPLADGKVSLDVSGYNKGLYIYRISGTDDKTLHTGKLTVIH